MQTTTLDEPEVAAGFNEMSNALVVIFACCRLAGWPRPASLEARSARSVATDCLELATPAGEVPKMIHSDDLPQMTMEAARLHSAASLAEDVAKTSFNSAIDSFERFFSEAFEGLEDWLDTTGPNGAKHTIATMNNDLCELKPLLQHITGCVDRWSGGALPEQLQAIVETLGTIAELIGCGLVVVASGCHKSLTGRSVGW